ncbi:uncharacterized protein FIBRA_02696 [Fibroporia radiculosa]|uniref:ubiquitinyl hydrolase 1 n=1 Tax=Fibroporia radiculosa TaxID=599839 RepID=J4G2D1_9APHY|nr:uncharacterized protein FIBRA_02696 [Fibroporia radiculosa]CCM00658.1 predicted protein [Fibroporia radiculosa]
MAPSTRASQTWNCSVCQRTFSRKYELNRHEVSHANVKPFECKHCQKCFAQKTALRTHYNSHTKLKPHQCVNCSISFGDPSSRSRHRHEMHSGFLGYFCPGCSSSMKRPKNFKIHLEKCDYVTKYNANIRVYMVYDESSEDFKEYFKDRKPPREARIVVGSSKKAVIVNNVPVAIDSSSPPVAMPSPSATKKAPSITAELSSIGRARRLKTLQRAHPYKKPLSSRRRESAEDINLADIPADVLQQSAAHSYTIPTAVAPPVPTEDVFNYVPVDFSYNAADDGILAQAHAQVPDMFLPGPVAGPSSNPEIAVGYDLGLPPFDVPQIPSGSSVMIPPLVYGQWAGDVPSYTDTGATYEAPISSQWDYQKYNTHSDYLYGIHGTQVTPHDDYSDLFETIATTPTEAIDAALQSLNTQPHYWPSNIPTLPAKEAISPYSPYSDALSPLSDLTPSPGGTSYSSPGTPADMLSTVGSRGPSPQNEMAYSLYRPPSSRPQYNWTPKCFCSLVIEGRECRDGARFGSKSGGEKEDAKSREEQSLTATFFALISSPRPTLALRRVLSGLFLTLPRPPPLSLILSAHTPPFMLASPLVPASGFADDTAQYRPAKDLEAFKSLLPPAIEFVEGSSSGTFATDEIKYQPINTTPKANRAEPSDSSMRKALPSTPTKASKSPRAPAVTDKPLYTGSLTTSWPSGTTVGSGLYNTGNTCFLNSALQCLLHTPPLLHVLIAHSKVDPCQVRKGAYCMACGLRSVMFDSHQKHRQFSPSQITSNMHVIAKHMRRGRQEDSHEFLRYAIDALQKACLAGYPPKLDPKLAETTWVHKIFGGRLRSRVTCLDCGHNSDTFDSVLDLSIDILGSSGLKEALRKFTAVDHLKGADKYKCEKCKKAVTADKQFTVHDAPLVLTIHLKRFSPIGGKIGQPVKYDERLSLQSVMSSGQHGPSYVLYAVISHAGGGPNSGHYYAHVKGSNGQWYEMNDDSVTRHPGAPTGMKNAYILFYIRDKGQALEAAVNAPAKILNRDTTPAKMGIVANMKKRKAVESDDESSLRPKSKTSAPFIGPRLPSPVPASTADTSKANANAIDPQAEVLKKKIAAVGQSPSSALLSLAQYDDEDDEDIGEKVNEMKTTTPDSELVPSSPVIPPSSSTASSTQEVQSSTPPPLTASTSTPSVFTTISTSSFYGTKSKGKDESNSKKRKSPEPDPDDPSISQWARTPISPGLSLSTPTVGRRQSGGRSGGIGSGSPFNRIKGSNNLAQRRDAGGPIQQYGRKKRLIM